MEPELSTQKPNILDMSKGLFAKRNACKSEMKLGLVDHSLHLGGLMRCPVMVARYQPETKTNRKG